MAYANHALIQFNGDWGSNADALKETWSFGIRVCRGSTATYLTDPQTYANNLGPAVKTWWTATANGMSSNARLLTLKVNNINPAGHYADPNTHLYTLIQPCVGGATPWMDHCLTLAWTWRTNMARGRANHGRVYPPNPSYQLAGLFTVSSTNANAQLTAAKALLTIISTTLDAGTAVTPVVTSKIDGTTNAINKVEVDTIYDVQRRRKKSAVGVRVASAWP